MKKIVCVGVNKTGTTTLGIALGYLGYKNLDFNDQNFKLYQTSAIKELLEISEDFDSFTDSPWHLLYKNLDQLYPEAKFILTIRDDRKWLNSVLNYYDSRVKYNTINVLTKLIFGAVSDIKTDRFLNQHDESLLLKLYHKRNTEVINYFKDRPEKLLIVNWEQGSGWSDLCKFLGVDIPKVKFPHVMKTVSKNRFLVQYYFSRFFQVIRMKPSHQISVFRSFLKRRFFQ